MRSLLVLAALALLISGCLTSGCALRVPGRVHVFPRCADGLPPRILRDVACPPDGICGYSCCPGRWDEPR